MAGNIRAPGRYVAFSDPYLSGDVGMMDWTFRVLLPDNNAHVLAVKL